MIVGEEQVETNGCERWIDFRELFSLHFLKVRAENFFHVEEKSQVIVRGKKCRLKILKCRQQQHLDEALPSATRDGGGGRSVDIEQLSKNQK